jgi:hypothetical protein
MKWVDYDEEWASVKSECRLGAKLGGGGGTGAGQKS